MVFGQGMDIPEGAWNHEAIRARLLCCKLNLFVHLETMQT